MTDKIFKDKKGDLPTLVLVIGVFAICGLIIFSLSFSLGLFKQKFDILNSMSSLTSTADLVRFYENSGKDISEISNVRKEGNIYIISAEEIQNEKRVFYGEYRLVANSDTLSP